MNNTSKETKEKLYELYMSCRENKIRWREMYPIVLDMCVKGECTIDDVIEAERKSEVRRIPPMSDSIIWALSEINNDNQKDNAPKD